MKDQVKIITDASEIARVKARCQEQREKRFSYALQCVRRGEALYTFIMDDLESQRNRAIDELLKSLNDSSIETRNHPRIAQALIHLGEPRGATILLDAVGSTDADVQAGALNVLNDWDPVVDSLEIERLPESANLLSLLDTQREDIGRAALAVCVRRRVPGAANRLVELLRSHRAPDPKKIARQLASIADTDDAIELTLQHLFHDASEKYDTAIPRAAQQIRKHADARSAELARQMSQQYLLGFEGRQRYDQSLVRELAEIADQGALPVLEEIHQNARDSVSRDCALEGIARLLPAKSVDLALGHLQKEKLANGAIKVLRQHASRADIGRTIAALRDKAQQKTLFMNCGDYRPLVQFALDQLGSEGREFITQIYDTLNPRAKMWADWKLGGLNLRTCLTELHAAGIIAIPAEELITKMQASRKADPYVADPTVDIYDPESLMNALFSAGILLDFDVESDRIPSPHDRLIVRFAKTSCGKFEPECVYQLWHQSNEDDYEADYTVEFVYSDRLFHFSAKNYGDYYDAEAVVGAINLALASVDRSERFVALTDNGQVAGFVFADPAAFTPIATKYGLPLSKDSRASLFL